MLTPCSGQPHFRPCKTCARFKPVALMRPIRKLRTCALYEPLTVPAPPPPQDRKSARTAKGKHGVPLIAYAGKEA